MLPVHGPEAAAHVAYAKVPDIFGDRFYMKLAHLRRFPECLHVVVVVVLQDTPDDDGREFIEVQRGIQAVVFGAALPEILFHLPGKGCHVDVYEVEMLLDDPLEVATVRRRVLHGDPEMLAEQVCRAALHLAAVRKDHGREVHAGPFRFSDCYSILCAIFHLVLHLTRQMSAVVASIWQAIPGPRRCVSVRPVSPRCLNG